MSDPVFLYRRRHPDYLKHEAVWRHCAEACRGGSDYLAKTLIRHVSEIDIEFAERKRRAYYFNYPRNIASRITQQVMAVPPVRSGADPALVEDWSRTGLRTNEVIRQLSNMLTVYGTAWIQIDAPSFQQPVSRKQAAADNLRPYVRLLSPLEVTDWSYGDDGKLEWALIREERYDSPDPFCEGSFWENVKLFKRGQWQSFSRRNGVISENGSGLLPDGELPLFKVTENEGVRSESPHWFEDMVRISEAIFNNESESQMNMVKQMFGLLVVSESFARGALPDLQRENAGFASTVARSAAVIETVEEKGISRYISPSGVPGTLLRQENEALKRELFELAGLTITSISREAQSAESKAWDFRNASCFLAGRADLLEQSEQRAWELMKRFDPSVPVPQVVYNKEFEVRELGESIAALLQLSTLEAGSAFRKNINKTAVEMLSNIFPLPEKEKITLLEEVSR